MAELAEEAARLGCEVWEIEKVKARMREENSDSSDSDSKEESKVDKK